MVVAPLSPPLLLEELLFVRPFSGSNGFGSRKYVDAAAPSPDLFPFPYKHSQSKHMINKLMLAFTNTQLPQNGATG